MMNTNESATAALKGMLGIGGGGGTAASSSEKQETAILSDFSVPSCKKSSKNKREGGAKKTKQKQPNSNTSNKGSATKNPNSNKKQPENKPVSESFAWSAFQASPDASALPLPAFITPISSAKVTLTDVTIDPDKLSILLSAVRTTDSEAPLAIVNAPRAEDVEAQAIAAAQKQAASEGRDEMENAQEETKQNPENEQVSAGGINIAALATSTPSNKAKSMDLPTPGPELGSSSLPPFSSPQHQQFASPQHQQQYIPPGYMTIQVQVPPHLMPERLMIVHTPAGYPVQVIVPEGVPPGMIIPVLVPAAPAHMMPLLQQYQQQHGMQQPYYNAMHRSPRG